MIDSGLTSFCCTHPQASCLDQPRLWPGCGCNWLKKQGHFKLSSSLLTPAGAVRNEAKRLQQDVSGCGLVHFT